MSGLRARFLPLSAPYCSDSSRIRRFTPILSKKRRMPFGGTRCKRRNFRRVHSLSSGHRLLIAASLKQFIHTLITRHRSFSFFTLVEAILNLPSFTIIWPSSIYVFLVILIFNESNPIFYAQYLFDVI